MTKCTSVVMPPFSYFLRTLRLPYTKKDSHIAFFVMVIRISRACVRCNDFHRKQPFLGRVTEVSSSVLQRI